MSPLIIICGAFIFPLINSQQVDLSLFPKIVGGQDVVNLDNFSYQVSIQELGSHVCGGTIINQNHVLTAAHCCTNKYGKALPSTIYSVVSGTLTLNNKTLFRHPASRIYVHEHYDSDTLENDIAIIRILGSFPNNTRPLTLADSEMPNGTDCIVSGWEDDEYNGVPSNALQYVIVPIWTTETCKYFYDDYYIASTMFCAGVPGTDFCQENSGAPLVCNGRLAGIFSWSIECDEDPGVYTKVYKYRQWISTHIKYNISKNIGFKSNPTTSHVVLILGILLTLRSYFEEIC